MQPEKNVAKPVTVFARPKAGSSFMARDNRDVRSETPLARQSAP
jgi:hypothetical protein